jgi:hypothetical protein
MVPPQGEERKVGWLQSVTKSIDINASEPHLSNLD